MTSEYFQLGGFRPQIQWFQSTYDDKRLAEAIAGSSSPLRSQNGNGPVELVLGIKRSGASHLLLTTTQTRDFSASMRLPLPRYPPFRARDFESLSPITFGSVDELTKKLTTLKPKAGKGRGGDTSQANRGYTNADERDEPSYRSAFEHGRVLYGILNQTIDPRKFGIDDASWTQKLRVCSFVFNTRGVDDRHSSEKIRNPTVLDVGFCEARLPALTPDYASAKHVVNSGNMLLGRKQPKRTFSHGSTENVPADSMKRHIQAFFKDHQGSSTDAPMILLVYHKEQTMNYLGNMGVKTDFWRLSGIKDVLMPEGANIKSELSPPRSRDPRRYSSSSYSRDSSFSSNGAMPLPYDRRRSRSRSPQRRQEYSQTYGQPHYTPSSSSSRYQPSSRGSAATTTAISRRSCAPVYVLDVRELYANLTQVESASSLVDVARSFGLTNEEGWCAGNEAAMIIDVWKAMVSSLPIDEQRALRSGGLNPSSTSSSTTPAPASEPPSQPSYTYDSDDEQDPNDIVVQPQVQAQGAAANDALYNFDESDYGSDSEED